MLTPLSPNVLGYDATPTPTAVELYKLLDATGAEATFTPFAMALDGDGVFWGTLDGECVPLTAEGETWSLLWKTTLEGYEDPIYDRQTLQVGFESVAGGALCTREQVKGRGAITTAGQDALINSLIPVVLPKVSNRYGCEFMPRVTEARTFDVRSRLVELVGSDLRTVTTVVMDPNGTPRTLVEGTGYVLVPCRLTGTYTEIRLSDALNFRSEYASRFGMMQIAITGEWGIWGTLADVPADIQEAAVECVLSWMQKPVSDITAIDSSAPRQIVAGTAQTWDIPASAHRAFQPYNRVSGIY